MIRNPTYTKFNNVLLYYYKYRGCILCAALLSGRNTINLRLISDYRNEDKDFSPEPRRVARVNTPVLTCIV